MRWYATLRRSGSFARVRQRGRRIELELLRVFCLHRGSGPVRIGISVPGAVGGAVVRNRVRRRIQGALASLRPGRDSALQPADVVFVVRPHTATAPYPTLAREVGASLALAIGYEA